ncbi:MAG: biotin transporter BioY [Oscillospiraceae bacterium]|jgi:biotin transport system substrate-specific component|nr:biotin transporter BioY [Oscillospiraceae bacterium]
MKQLTIRDIAKCAVFTAILAVCSVISIPLPLGVPVNLALLGVYLAALMLPPGQAFFSVLAFVLLGTFGVPVFAGFRGGLSVLAGPTGGFIAGYLLTVLVISVLKARFGLKRRVIFPALVLGLLATYIPGIIWFAIVTGYGVGKALTACVIPFLPGDAAKIIIAAEVSLKVVKLLPARTSRT